MTMADSCQIAHKVMALFPDAKIVALAVPENEDNIVECAEVGIAGYVAREASLDELIDTVIGAKKGEFCCPPKIAAHIFKKFHDIACGACNLNRPPASREPGNLLTGLTKREQQIFNLMACGLSNKLISRDLNIEVSTVKNHVHNILVKLDVKNRAGAISLLYGASAPLPVHESLAWNPLPRGGR
jgi:DNA-binding NarL/FixJ family response regulator